jgi:hypothetical protein
MKAFFDGSGDKSSDFIVLTGVAALERVLPFRRVEMGHDRLSQLALYAGLIPDSVIEEFGPAGT